MPTYIRVAYQEPQGFAFPRELSAISVFLMIGLLQIAVAILADGQWAAVAEQTIW
jgi:hypothetical protein